MVSYIRSVTRWHHAQVRLAVVGKDGQEEDRLGMEVQRLQPVVVENLIKVVGERRDQPDSNAAREEGEEGASLRLRHVGGKPELRLAPSLLSPAVSRRAGARLFSVTVGASRAGSYQAGTEEGLVLRGAMGCRCGAKLEQIWRFQQRGARKGIWSKARKKQ